MCSDVHVTVYILRQYYKYCCSCVWAMQVATFAN